MSERVEREFKEWKERYEIPHYVEFQVKTLLSLQEEYDNIVPAENNTKRRELLIHMINDLLQRLSLQARDRKYFETIEKVDNAWDVLKEDEKDKLFVFIENAISEIKPNMIHFHRC